MALYSFLTGSSALVANQTPPAALPLSEQQKLLNLLNPPPIPSTGVPPVVMQKSPPASQPCSVKVYNPATCRGYSYKTYVTVPLPASNTIFTNDQNNQGGVASGMTQEVTVCCIG